MSTSQQIDAPDTSVPVIRIRGDINRDNEHAIDDAIVDLTTGAHKLQRQYIGVKDYDRFRGQRTDCEYGYGPTHGHIVFAIELTEEARKRLKGGGCLSDLEIAEAVAILRPRSVGNPLRDFGPPPKPTVVIENPEYTAWIERAAVSLCAPEDHGCSPCRDCLRLARRFANVAR